MLYELKLNKRFADLKCCVIIPTYNNQNTVEKIITDTLEYTDKVIVVNDGATDSTPTILKQYGNTITIIHQPKNYGKGIALRTAFKKALELGYHYAITIDSDGQHFPSDFELFLNTIEQQPDALIIGARNMNSENVPGKSSFGNKFSNFWFWVETGIKMPDTQSGYRLYPLHKMRKLTYFTSRFEFEIEVIVKAAWKGIPVIPVPIQVYYAKGDERVTHFRPGKDFTRISFLNTYLVILAFLWYRPLRLLRGLSPGNIKAFLKKHFLNETESNAKKSFSVAIGIFFGIVPIWGYQLVTAILVAYLLKLNKAIVILAANISVPVMLPAILFASLKTGELVTGELSTITFQNISLENIKLNLYVYLVGAVVLSIVFALFMGIITYVFLSMLRNNKKPIAI
jgi:glycosyltransferase involved in cell wall biosynthesis